MATTKLRFDGDNNTRRTFREIGQGLTDITSRIRVAGGAMRGFAALLVGGALARSARDSLNFADQVQKLSIATKASTEFLSEMRFVAEQAGSSFEGLQKQLVFMQDAIGEATKGTKSQADAFTALGIDARRLAELLPEQQFLLLVDRIQGVDNAAKRVQLARDIFGRSGTEFLQIAEGGTQAVEALRDRARELGLSLTRDATDGAARANDALNAMRRSGSALSQSIALSIGPGVAALGEALANFIPKAVSIAQGAFRSFAGGVARLLGGVLSAVSSFAERLADAMDFFTDGGGDGLRAAAARVQGFSSVLSAFGEKERGAAAEAVRMAFAVREVGKAAEESSADVEDLQRKVEGTTPTTSEAVKKGLEDAEPELNQFGQRIVDTLVNSGRDGSNGFRGEVVSMIDDLGRQLARSLLLRVFLQLFPGLGAGAGAAISGTSAAIPQRRFGGPVRAGELYETHGLGSREFFVPGADGAIVRGGGGMVFNIDARGAVPGVEQRIQRAVFDAVHLSEVQRRDQEGRGR